MKSMRMLLGTVIVLLLCNVAFAGTPVAYYTFDVDGSDAMGSYDADLEEDASIVNDATRGNCLYLKDDGYVIVPPEISAELENFSFTTWINFNGTVEWAGLMGMGIDVLNEVPYWDFHIQGDPKGKMSYYASELAKWPGDGTAQTIIDYALPAVEWTHIAFTFELGAGGLVYINGVPQAQEDWNSSNDHDVSPQLIQPEIITIGRDAFNQGTLTDTYIDDFLFFKEALSADDVVSVYNGIISDVEHHSTVVKGFSLAQNYPNPFNPSTRIDYTLDKSSNVELSVYNVTGQKIATLVNSLQNVGNHHAVWNASDAPAGIYLYELKTENTSQIKKMMLVK